MNDDILSEAPTKNSTSTFSSNFLHDESNIHAREYLYMYCNHIYGKYYADCAFFSTFDLLVYH